MVNFELEEVVGLITKQPAEFLGTLKTEEGEWKPKDEILAAIRKADKDRLDGIAKSEAGKATRLRMKSVQDTIRKEYGVESDGELEDHLKALVENIKAKSGTEKIVKELVELTEETALQHPVVKTVFRTEMAKVTADLQKQIEAKDKEYKEYVEKDSKKKLASSIIQATGKALTEIKAALDKNPAQQERQIKKFAVALQSEYRFKLDADDNPYPVDDNGEQLQDSSYQPMTYLDLVKQENIFGVHNYDPDKDSPSPKNQQTNSPKFTGVVPKTQNEFLAAIKNEPDKARREAIRTAFKQLEAKK